jgi:hypothetical protein
MTEASASQRVVTTGGTGGQGQPAHGGQAKSWLSKVFAYNSAGLHWSFGVLILDVMLVPLVVFWAIGHDEYLSSALFGVVWTAVADPGGSYGTRASRLAVFGLIGAALVALGFAVGGDAWGWLVLAIFAVTLVAGLTVMFGAHRAFAASLLNTQFIIALATAFGYQQTLTTSHIWAQVLAWAGGAALWIAVTFIRWLIRGRRDEPAPIAEAPGDTSRHPLTGPVVMFAVIRAAVVAGAAALAFGLNLSHGEWLVFGTFAATKATLKDTTLRAEQRVTGAVMGAAAAALLLLIPANEHGAQLVSITHGLDVVAIILLMHAASTFFWNYAFYEAAVVAAVLISLDLPQPSNFSAEGYRVLWTLCGVAIGVVVMFIASLLAKGTARAPAQPATQRA